MESYNGLIPKPQKAYHWTCRRKIHYYDINLPLDRWVEIVEAEGYLPNMGIYICGDHYHLGNLKRSRYSQTKTLCLWCGNWIRPVRLGKHQAKCGRTDLLVNRLTLDTLR